MPRPVSNPPNPWESTHVEWLGPPPEAKLEVYEERARTVLGYAPKWPLEKGYRRYCEWYARRWDGEPDSAHFRLVA